MTSEKKYSSIDDLNLSDRVTAVLKRAGIRDAKELSNWTEAQLIDLRNLGSNDIPSIKRALRSQGLRLKK